MHIFIGSTNQAKIEAVKRAVFQHIPDLEIQSFSVTSDVAEQPLSDDETRTGAFNRATAALTVGLATNPGVKPDRCLGVGLEGGVFTDAAGEVWSTVWVCVVTASGERFESNGARVKLPEIIAQPILAGGEMGPVVDQILQKEGKASVRQNHGMIGVITNNFTDRIEEYATIAKLAFGLWYGRNWRDDLRKSKTNN